MKEERWALIFSSGKALGKFAFKLRSN